MTALDQTYSPRLDHAIIGFSMLEMNAQHFPEPLPAFRTRFYRFINLDYKSLPKHQRTALKVRFYHAIQRLEGVILKTTLTTNEKKQPLKIIDLCQQMKKTA